MTLLKVKKRVSPYDVTSVPLETSQAVQALFIRTRLNVALRNPKTNQNIQEFSMSCNYFTKLTGLLNTPFFFFFFGIWLKFGGGEVHTNVCSSSFRVFS